MAALFSGVKVFSTTLARDRERGVIVALLDEFPELGGARDVRALADVDERRAGGGGHLCVPINCVGWNRTSAK